MLSVNLCTLSSLASAMRKLQARLLAEQLLCPLAQLLLPWLQNIRSCAWQSCYPGTWNLPAVWGAQEMLGRLLLGIFCREELRHAVFDKQLKKQCPVKYLRALVAATSWSPQDVQCSFLEIWFLNLSQATKGVCTICAKLPQGCETTKVPPHQSTVLIRHISGNHSEQKQHIKRHRRVLLAECHIGQNP